MASFLTLQLLRKKEGGEEGRERTGKGSRNGFNINCSVKTRGIKNSEEGFQVLPHEGTLTQVDVLRRWVQEIALLSEEQESSG